MQRARGEAFFIYLFFNSILFFFFFSFYTLDPEPSSELISDRLRWKAATLHVNAVGAAGRARTRGPAGVTTSMQIYAKGNGKTIAPRFDNIR